MAGPVSPRFVLGCAQLGNLYRARSEEEAAATLEEAWDAGIRQFDTAPHYGLGLSERRLGAFLRDKPRDTRPQRVKVGGDLFHGRVPEGAVYVGRATPGLRRSPYSNLFTVNRSGLAEALRRYRAYLDEHPELVERARRELRGHDLACWCPLPAEGEEDRCHGAISLEVLYPT
jgi:hypothetical protein